MFKLKKLAMVLLPLTVVATSVCADPLAGNRIALPSQGLSLVSQAKFIGPVKANTPMHFTVWLKLRNKEQLDKLVPQLYDQNSPNYHKFLTKNELDQQYAPTPDVEEAVLHYFTSKGMTAKIVNHSVRVTATTQQVEQAFKIKINRYRYQDRTVFANATAPTLSSDIAQHVSEISGLSNIVLYRPNYRTAPNSIKQKSASIPQDLNLTGGSYIPAAQPTTTSLAGFTGVNLRTAYNLANIKPVNGITINGAGQTLVIIDACGTQTAAQITADANLYNTANSLPQFARTGTSQNFAVINSDGSPFGGCTHPSADWDIEIALDVESSHTIATGANTVLVLADGADNLDNTVGEVIDLLTTNNFVIGGFPNAYVVSNSWGAALEGGSANPGMETTLLTAAAAGISFDFSTGDCGDETYTSGVCTAASTPGTPTVQYPSSSVSVTAVGGTSLFVDNNWSYAFEIGWGTYRDGSILFGAGGGLSLYYDAPTWQTSGPNNIGEFTAAGYTGGNIAFYGTRALPDVAMLADPFTGLIIYEGGTSFAEGGTSLACPLFSATLTLINQARAVLHAGTPSPIGLAAPVLYGTNNTTLLIGRAINLIIPPSILVTGGTLLPSPVGAPPSAFTLLDGSDHITFGYNSSLSLTPALEYQYWNDAAGNGSPNIPNFISVVANM